MYAHSQLYLVYLLIETIVFYTVLYHKLSHTIIIDFIVMISLQDRSWYECLTRRVGRLEVIIRSDAAGDDDMGFSNRRPSNAVTSLHLVQPIT